MLCVEPTHYIGDLSWLSKFGEVQRTEVEDWGKVQSIRVFYTEGPEVEFGVTSVDWVTFPLDAGTSAVLANGRQFFLIERTGSPKLSNRYSNVPTRLHLTALGRARVPLTLGDTVTPRVPQVAAGVGAPEARPINRAYSNSRGIEGARDATGVVVVVDVLRAFTTAAYAFAAASPRLNWLPRLRRRLPRPVFGWVRSAGG